MQESSLFTVFWGYPCAAHVPAKPWTLSKPVVIFKISGTTNWIWGSWRSPCLGSIFPYDLLQVEGATRGIFLALFFHLPRNSFSFPHVGFKGNLSLEIVVPGV